MSITPLTKKENVVEEPRVYDVLKEIEKEDESQASSLAGLVHGIINQELGKTYYDIKEKKEKHFTNGDKGVIILMYYSEKLIFY